MNVVSYQEMLVVVMVLFNNLLLVSEICMLARNILCNSVECPIWNFKHCQQAGYYFFFSFSFRILFLGRIEVSEPLKSSM